MASDREHNLDLLVVGAGVIGLACAWRAAERGLSVRVLERDRAGAGASMVAAGMLAPVGEASWAEGRLLELTLRSHRLWPRFAEELAAASSREIGYLPRGALHVALDRDELSELRRRFALMEGLGLDVEWTPAGRLRDLEPGISPRAAGGIDAPREAAVDPRALTAALEDAAAGLGVEVLCGSEAVETLLEGERVAGVRPADAREHRASTTVVASGAWSASGWLPGRAQPRVRPVKGQILTLRSTTGSPVCERIIVTEHVYLVPRADGRLVIGATVEEQGFDTRVTAGGVHELLREAYRVLPEIAELEMVETLAGLRPATEDNLPLVGASQLDGLLLATGHFRNGILLAPLTAELIVAELTGEPVAVEHAVASR